MSQVLVPPSQNVHITNKEVIMGSVLAGTLIFIEGVSLGITLTKLGYVDKAKESVGNLFKKKPTQQLV